LSAGALFLSVTRLACTSKSGESPPLHCIDPSEALLTTHRRIVTIANKTQCIGIQGASSGGSHEGSQSISFDSTSQDKDLLWYLRLAPDAILNCVD
jgi:hypothetical protein